MKHLVAAVLLAAVTPGTAVADDEPPQVTTTITRSEWYGGQLLLADGAVLGTAVATKNGEVALGWVVSGALVHAAHGNSGRAAASIGLRVALPVAGILLGAASASGCSGFLCGIGPAVTGGLIGMGTAEVVDVATASEETTYAVPVPTTRWTPVATVKPQSATVGFAATF